MIRIRHTVDEALAMLEDHPERIAAATRTIGAARLRRERVLGEWTAVDVLAHLRCCCDARGDIIPDIVAGKTMRAIDPRKLIEQTDYRDLAFATSFRAFARQRAGLVRYLRHLSRRDWFRDALFTGFGTPRRRSVLFYANWIVRHEQAHVHHIERHFVSRTRRSAT